MRGEAEPDRVRKAEGRVMDGDWVVIVGAVVAIAMVLVLAAGGVLVVRDSIRRRGRWGLNFRHVQCPRCGTPAPAIRKPRNRRQMLWGGCTCEECGLEYDKWGVEVTDPAES